MPPAKPRTFTVTITPRAEATIRRNIAALKRLAESLRVSGVPTMGAQADFAAETLAHLVDGSLVDEVSGIVFTSGGDPL
jgi:hypothetical protein